MKFKDAQIGQQFKFENMMFETAVFEKAEDNIAWEIDGKLFAREHWFNGHERITPTTRAMVNNRHILVTHGHGAVHH